MSGTAVLPSAKVPIFVRWGRLSSRQSFLLGFPMDQGLCYVCQY